MPSRDELAETATSGATEASAPGSAPSRPPGTPPGPGDSIGRYVIERVLGTGGMGVVYAAHDPDLDRRVALKLLHGAGAVIGEEARTRLLREARAMAKVNHPNVITVYEVGTASGIDFVAMELIDGTNGADWLRKTKRAPADVLRMLTSAGRGLAAAHAMGLVHRDFKPANILISRGGKVVVTDFGLARAYENADEALAATAHPERRASASSPESKGPLALDATLEATPSAPPRSHSGDLSSTITRTGALLGTPAYMAPEQFAGQHAGPKADQYALAVAIWEGLAGARPFRGTSFDELKAAVDRGPDSAADADRIPRRIRGILERALARDPAARWPDVDALLAAIDRAARRPRQLVLVAAALVAAAGLAALVYVSRGRTHTQTRIIATATCGISDADLAEVWSPAIGASIAAHIGDEAVWAKHGAAIEEAAGTWRAERAETCKHPEAREFHGRIACLLAIRDELGAVIQLGQTLPVDTLRGAQISEVLPDPTSCRAGVRAATPQLPSDPAERAALSALYREGTTAILAARMGKKEEARAISKPALAKARAENNPLRLALALQFGGTVEHISGNCPEAETLYAEAAMAAESAQAGGVRAMSTMGQLECFMQRNSDIEAVRRLARQAQAAVDGAGGDRGLRAALDMNLADIDALAGDLDKAIERTAAARRVFAETKDLRRNAVAAQSEAALREYRNGPGDVEAALALTREQLTAAENVFGPDHPLSRAARKQLAARLLATHPDEARAMFAALDATRPPDDPAEPEQERDARAFGRVLGADGAPAIGARVYASAVFIGSDDGLPLPVGGEERPIIVETDAQGRFDIRVPRRSVVLAAQGDLRSQVIRADARELTLRLGPARSAEGTLTLDLPGVPADAERAARLAARAAPPMAALMGADDIATYQCISRLEGDRWSIHGLPPASSLRAGIAVTTGLGERSVYTIPLEDAPMALRMTLRAAAIDIIVRADRAAAIPTAQVLVMAGRLAKPPRDIVALNAALGRSGRWAFNIAAPVSDETRTEAGGKLYQPSDIHARFAAFEPGPVTACVVPFSGDVRDETFLRTLTARDDLEVKCTVLDVAPAPAVQAFVVETPPMRRNTPTTPSK